MVKTIIRVIESEFSFFPGVLDSDTKKAEQYLPGAMNDMLLDSDGRYMAEKSAIIRVIGRDDPEEFIKVVRSWNQEIHDEAVRAVDKWRNNFGSEEEEHKFDLTEARRALDEADDIFTPSGSHCVIGAYDDIHTLLYDFELEDMVSHPDHYAIVEVEFQYRG